MILIVGLGNPGIKYRNNRHNAGHMFINYLVNELTGSSVSAKATADKRVNGLNIIKTNCYMNMSGIFVKKLTTNYKLQTTNLIIVHDDLDIPLGKFHIQFASGPQLHNGLESIEDHLRSKDFWRVRIGIDARLARRSSLPTGRQVDEGGKPEQKIPGEIYTLQNFLPDEKKLLETEIFPKIFTQLKLFLKTQFKVTI